MVVLDGFFFIWETRKKWSLVALDWWLSYTVMIVWKFAWVGSALVILDKWLSYRGGRLSRFDFIPQFKWKSHVLYIVCWIFVYFFFFFFTGLRDSWLNKYLKNDVWLKGSLLGFCLLAETQYAFFSYLVFMKHNKYWIWNHKLPQRLLCSWKYFHRNFLGPLKIFQSKYLGIKRQ